MASAKKQSRWPRCVRHPQAGAGDVVAASLDATGGHLAVLTSSAHVAVYTAPAWDAPEGQSLTPRLTRALACYAAANPRRLALIAFDKAYVAVIGETPDRKCTSMGTR
jgi:hypothetical protein